MPVDLRHSLPNPRSHQFVFNQIIYLPIRSRKPASLARRKIAIHPLPNPSNQIAVEDIKKVEE
jgi:hypothetical protein